MANPEATLNSLVEQMREFVEKKEDGTDKSLFTPLVMKMCLRSKDYDITKAYQLGLKYFERLEHQKIHIESQQKLMLVLGSDIVRVLCSKGLRSETIIVVDLCAWTNTKEIDEELIPCTIAVVLDYLLRDELFQTHGCFILFDLLHLNLKHLSQIRKRLIKKILNALEFTVPIKIKRLFILSADRISQIVFLKFLKAKMSKELRDKMMIVKKGELGKLSEFMSLLIIEGQIKFQKLKFLNLPVLVAEALALDAMPGYVFDQGTVYCSLLPTSTSEDDNEMLNASLQDVKNNGGTELESPKLDETASGSKN